MVFVINIGCFFSTAGRVQCDFIRIRSSGNNWGEEERREGERERRERRGREREGERGEGEIERRGKEREEGEGERRGEERERERRMRIAQLEVTHTALV